MTTFRSFFVVTIFAFATSALASEIDVVRKDLLEACKISKEARKLLKTRKYQKDPNALNVWIQKEMKSRIKTEDILNLSNTVGLVDERTRENIWRQTADDLGVPEWECPGIGEIL